jgi:hypothetical protein
MSSDTQKEFAEKYVDILIKIGRLSASDQDKAYGQELVILMSEYGKHITSDEVSDKFWRRICSVLRAKDIRLFIPRDHIRQIASTYAYSHKQCVAVSTITKYHITHCDQAVASVIAGEESLLMSSIEDVDVTIETSEKIRDMIGESYRRLMELSTRHTILTVEHRKDEEFSIVQICAERFYDFVIDDYDGDDHGHISDEVTVTTPMYTDRVDRVPPKDTFDRIKAPKTPYVPRDQRKHGKRKHGQQKYGQRKYRD